ncbi:alpha/beta fold hydrolase [Rubrivivax gelatinosus]|uniref:Pimeloyl-ACP methyl ester carboxylesterase n=1 Tax=Rubrivivax gelatinosus TaxID=28068 RepID=A0A4R2LZ16_RUBGE|nr:alpha/beta fold hydrolase [Rubrivivax gelatinosus]MBK1690035.1 alpha/beta hydrolase [Rubrivivax gelatinosus]TCO97664.1 pimeloyl-ACP methyl ester carboxylesterase [Rubrivivax gelatinosus]
MDKHTSPPSAAPHTPLPPALAGEHRTLGDLGYYVAGRGRPLLLVHSVNAAGSAADVRPIFEHAAQGRTVFALDLPGFGSSERSDRDYTPKLMTDAVLAMLGPIRERCGPGPVDVLGVSLGCEFVARAALEAPQAFGRVALVSPTGFSGTRTLRGPDGSTLGKPWLHRLLTAKLWSDPLYRLLTRPGVVRYFLERTWGSKRIDETLWAYCVATARQPGARFAPLAFLAGNLFSADIQRVYESIAQPVWASHGVLGDFTDYRAMSIVAGKPNWRFSVYPTGAMPYFEVPRPFFNELDNFLAAPTPAAPRPVLETV